MLLIWKLNEMIYNMKPCQQDVLSDGAVYKEVVVIGNGPSGLVTSFMLAGNVPYLKEIPEDLPIDEMLRARLSNIPSGRSLYDVDLMELAEGLEGRSQNPVPLLMDILLRPCADMGIQADSLIEWKYEADKEIDHIVLGSGPPGGAWHGFPAGVRTLSPGGWLRLPPHAAAGGARLTARAVAEYCRWYVHACKLQRFFRCGVQVTSVAPAPRSRCPRAARYLVAGHEVRTGRPVRYLCARVVVAAGAAGRPGGLAPRVDRHALHDLAALERAVRRLRARTAPPSAETPSVLVVGSGVSAADAVRMCRGAGLGARHLHRAPADALARLSPQAYPDYCEIYKMMCDGPSGNYPNYNSYPDHVVVEVTPEPSDGHSPSDGDPPSNGHCPIDEAVRPKRVKLLNLATNETFDLAVSIIVILIGSKPDLFFLHTNFNLDCIDTKPNCQCNEDKKPSKRKIESDENQNGQCFLKNHWSYIKSLFGQSIQSCKLRYLNMTEINGNTDTKCIVSNCNRHNSENILKSTCNNLISKLENGVITSVIQKDKCECDKVHYDNGLECKLQCRCQPTNPFSYGLGYGVDPKKPVDTRSNPVAVDKSTHELLYGPKGIYALGPLTADNFIRFIPGGGLAVVSHMHKINKTSLIPVKIHCDF